MTAPVTLGSSYFDAMYEAARDPWGFESRWYERRKHAASLALLPREHYRDAFEPGCSIGVLSAMLAGRCGSLLSCDVAQAAVEAAEERTGHLPNVSVEHRVIPAEWPPGRFDLVVFSEFLYYFSDSDLARTLDLGTAALREGGTLLAVHWRHQVTEYPRTGDDVHHALAARPGLARLASLTEPDFLAEAYVRTDGAPQSVAQATGLV
jgi:protein-L-isoaspartate O-methyltransferase